MARRSRAFVAAISSTSLLGSYTNQSRNGPWLGSIGDAKGPQGPTVFTDRNGVIRMALAAWYGAVGGPGTGMCHLRIRQL